MEKLGVEKSDLKKELQEDLVVLHAERNNLTKLGAVDQQKLKSVDDEIAAVSAKIAEIDAGA